MITKEELAELEAGLEGVSRGPWEQLGARLIATIREQQERIEAQNIALRKWMDHGDQS